MLKKLIRILLFTILLKAPLCLANHNIIIVAPPDYQLEPNKQLGPYNGYYMSEILSLFREKIITYNNITPFHNEELIRTETTRSFRKLLISNLSLQDNNLTPVEISIFFLAHGSPRTDGTEGLQLWSGPNNNHSINFSSYLNIIRQVLFEKDITNQLQLNIFVNSCYGGLCIRDFNSHSLASLANPKINILGLIDENNVSDVKNFKLLMEEAKKIDLFFSTLDKKHQLVEGSQMSRWIYYLSLVPELVIIEDDNLTLNNLISSSNKQLPQRNKLDDLTIEHKILFAAALTTTYWGYKKLPFVIDSIKNDIKFLSINFDNYNQEFTLLETSIKIIKHILYDEKKELIEYLIKTYVDAVEVTKIHPNFLLGLLKSLRENSNILLNSLDNIYLLNILQILALPTRERHNHIFLREHFELFQNNIDSSSNVTNQIKNNSSNFKDIDLIEEFYLRAAMVLGEKHYEHKAIKNKLHGFFNARLTSAAEKQINLELEWLNISDQDFFDTSLRIFTILKFVMSLEHRQYFDWIEKTLEYLSKNTRLKKQFQDTFKAYLEGFKNNYTDINQLATIRLAYAFAFITDKEYEAEIKRTTNNNTIIKLTNPVLYKWFVKLNDYSPVTKSVPFIGSCAETINSDF